MRIRPCPPVWSGTQPAWPDSVIRFAHHSTCLRRLSGTAADQWQSLARNASGKMRSAFETPPGRRRISGSFVYVREIRAFFDKSAVALQRTPPWPGAADALRAQRCEPLRCEASGKYVGDRRPSIQMLTPRSADTCRSAGANAVRRRESNRAVYCCFRAGVCCLRQTVLLSRRCLVSRPTGIPESASL